jgi:hypothetical protein
MLLHQIPVPAPDRPAAVMQREAAFQEKVFEIRDILEELETSGKN